MYCRLTRLKVIQWHGERFDEEVFATMVAPDGNSRELFALKAFRFANIRGHVYRLCITIWSESEFYADEPRDDRVIVLFM